jgi:pimeloyl-ACP methyl ester carboxylesterase
VKDSPNFALTLARLPPDGVAPRASAITAVLEARGRWLGHPTTVGLLTVTRSTMPSATVVLVSPPCGSPAAWSRVIPLLDDHGVLNVGVQLPSCLPESDIDDAGYMRSVLDDCGDPVVLVGHSSGGLELTEVGGHPAVQHLVYMDAVMWDVGEPWGTMLAGEVAEGWAACVRVRRDVTEFDTDAVAAYLLSRGWAADDALEFASGFRPQRHAGWVLELTVAAWRSVPSTYISPNDSEMKRSLRELFASRATDVIEIEGDHFPNWRRPDEVADILARIAREVVTP